MKGQVVVALLVNAEGEVVCAESMNRHPLAVKLLDERVSRLRFKPVKPKAHDMTLKEASYTTKPQAQYMMFNRSKEEEHHGRRRKRLESAWNYLQWNMVTGIGVGRRQFLCHCSRRR
jgi:hypothetical protein